MGGGGESLKQKGPCHGESSGEQKRERRGMKTKGAIDGKRGRGVKGKSSVNEAVLATGPV